MKSTLIRGLAVCLALLGVVIHRGDTIRAVSDTIVISEFRVRGPLGGSDEFIELYNASLTPIEISGWKVGGSNNTGGISTRFTIGANVTLSPGCFFLATNTSTSGGPYSGTVAGNITYSSGITDDGGIALFNASGTVIDQVGMSTGSAYKEGTVLPSLGSSNLNRGYERKPGGAAGNATDTDTNSADFQLISPSNPQNASSPCIGGPQSTNPSGTMTANAQTYNIGDPITLTVNVTPGTNPTSTGIGVTANLAVIGLGTVTFFDDGTHGGDITAGDNKFSFSATIPIGASGGPKSLTATIVDSNSPPRTGTTSPATQITIQQPTAPAATGSANPASVPAGGTTVLTVNVTPGTFPTSSGLAVTLDLSSIGGAAQPLQLVSGTTFTASATVALATAPGGKTLPGTVSDAQGRSSPFSLPLTVTPPPPPGAGIVRINEVDADTPGSDTAEFVELYDGGVGNTPLKGLVVVFFDGASANNGTLGKQAYAAFDLDQYTTDANGYFVLGNAGVGAASLIFDPGPFGLLQNGPDAVGLYIGDATDFPAGTLATTTNLQDAIVYGTDDPSASALQPLLNAEQMIVNENATGNGTTQSSQRCPNGMGGFRNTSTYYPGTPTPGVANSCPPPRPPSDVVISQVYGGGGNAGGSSTPPASHRNDFVELFNRGNAAVDLTGWSIQYASSTGGGWSSNVQPLGGTIGPGRYYLVALASSGATGASLPSANISGLINLAGGSGKVALVSSFEPLIGNCPIYDPTIRDFVGYGSADCGEGSTTTAAGSNVTALFRKSNGGADTDNNAADFSAPATPNPRQTEPIIELGPLVLSRDPRVNGFNAPRDATIQVIFTEPVTLDSAWFNLTCSSSGPHNSVTFASSFGGQDQFLTPNDSFAAGEQCTMTILKDRVHDVDLDDAALNTDTLPTDVSWSFTVASGTAAPYPSSVHLTMGNPSNAGSDPSNYLMQKDEFAVSYNRDLGRPNWVSWHLSDEWVGTLTRVDTFRPDPQIPPNWYRVQSFDFSGSGFDRGHMTPNADRDKETSVPINQATFLMSNMVAQAPDNNQGPWAALEGYLRTLVETPQENEVYIVSGPAGVGGSGSENTAANPVTATLADGHVTVPQSTWKVALVLPKGTDDLSRVSCTTRTIAVIMPNVQGIRNNPWETYLTTVDAVEQLSGYDLFSNLPVPFQNCIEARKDGDAALPLVKGDQTIAFAAPPPHVYGDVFTAGATGGPSGNPVTFVASGACTSSGFNGATITAVAAGPCTIAASQAGNAAYNDAAGESVTIAIGTKAATITAANAGKTYGTPDPPLSASGSGFLPGDGIVVSAARANGEAPGDYTILPSAAGAALGNYAVTVVAGTFTIFPDSDGDGIRDSDDPDDDNDGIADGVDPAPLAAVNETFSDTPLGGHTSGVIIARNGKTVDIVDAPGAGVQITVGGAGAGPVIVQLDGKVETILLTDGGYTLTDPLATSTVTVTAGGPAQISALLNGSPIVIVVSAGSSVTYTETIGASGLTGLSIDAVSGTVTSNGDPITQPMSLIGPPLTADACKDGGWQRFNFPVSFKTQGDCVSYVVSHKPKGQ